MSDIVWTDEARAHVNARMPQSSDAGSERGRRGRGVGRGVRPLRDAPEALAVHRTLPRPLFREQLRRDRLRADRTQSPLSLVSIKVAADGDGLEANTVRAVDFVHSTMRESDALGFVDDDTLMVLMPDTTESGATIFVNRLSSSAKWLARRPEVANYPQELFSRLEGKSSAGPSILPLALSAPVQGKRVQLFIKRAIDIAGASALLVTLFPLMLLTAAAVKLTSPGPVLFRQVRVGRGFEPFVFLKFRSMHDKADDKVHREQVSRLITDNAALAGEEGDGEAKAFYKMKSDPRITPFGNFIRRTSIDELPQLVNVLKNEMSLVGPRPPLPYETELYDAWHLRRVLEVKPGLTGLWQVEGRSEVAFDEMVRLDLRYSREWSVVMDLKILFKTIWVVARCRGAA